MVLKNKSRILLPTCAAPTMRCSFRQYIRFLNSFNLLFKYLENIVRRKIVGSLLVFSVALVFIGCDNPTTDTHKRTNADLSALSVSSGTLSPAFAAGITLYTVNVANAVANIAVMGIKADLNAEISNNNWISQGLNVGTNTIILRVTAQDGTTVKNYVVTVTRVANADLSNLAVSTGTLSPAFAAGTTAYSVGVVNTVTSITVTGTKSDVNAMLSANSGLAQTLNVGVNPITISVTAQDGSTVKNYVVTVTRASASNADLSALAVSTGSLSPAFTAGTMAYTVSVPNSTTSITITGTTSDANATLSANSGLAQTLNVGANPITIAVTAQDGTTVKNYVVTVTRAANADLSALVVSTGSLGPAFAAGTTAYNVSVANGVTSITVTGTKADTNATVSANNGVAQTLSVGANTITIAVTGQDGATVKNYVVRVTRGTVNDYFSISIGLVKYVPAGTFQRDASASNTSTVSAFHMSQYEITRAQFAALLTTDPSNSTYSSGTTDPVQMTNWYHAIAFCNKLSLAEGLTQVYTVTGVNFATLTYAAIPTSSNTTWDAAIATWTNNGYRLPTEMEWMWAAMGATGTGTNTTGYLKAFAGSTGSNAIEDYAVYGFGSGQAGATTTIGSNPVGSKTANELGLYDLSGNASEWCWDWEGSYPTGAQTDYRGAASVSTRVQRGGSWTCEGDGCTVAIRNDFALSFGQSPDIGFRVVRP